MIKSYRDLTPGTTWTNGEETFSVVTMDGYYADVLFVGSARQLHVCVSTLLRRSTWVAV